MGDGEKLFTHLNSALKVLLGLDIFSRVPKKKLNFVDQCYCKRYGIPECTRYEIVLDQFIREPDDDSKESKHVARK